MSDHILEEYLAKTKRYHLKEHPSDLLALIDEHLEHAHLNEAEKAFFQAEKAYFGGSYDTALRHYMVAKGIPDQGFYCYRASAAVSAARNEPERAIAFAKKALQFRSQDISTLRLLHQLLESSKQSHEAEEVEQQIDQALQSQDTNLEQENPHALFTEENVFAEDTQSLLLQEPYHVHPLRQSETPLVSLDKIYEQRNTEIETEVEGKIERKIAHFRKQLSRALFDYETRNTLGKEHSLIFLSGLKARPWQELFIERLRESSSGWFLRWNGKGIVVNPGQDFLNNFHKQDLNVRAIDYVITTHDTDHIRSSILDIYELNAALNQSSSTRHTIHYYLNASCFQALSLQLKPASRHERQTVHALELFSDSQEIELLDLHNGITLRYFAVHTKHAGHPHKLGIRFDLQSDEMEEALSIGYVTETPWSPLLPHLLGNCHIVIAGFGNTSPQDLAQTGFSEDGLGLQGALSLIHATTPKLLLLTEFGGQGGDIRLEAAHILRQQNTLATAIFPADTGLTIDLHTTSVLCGVHREPATLDNVRVLQSGGPGSPLLYSSTHQIL